VIPATCLASAAVVRQSYRNFHTCPKMFEHSLWDWVVVAVVNEHLSGHRPEFATEKDLREDTRFGCCPLSLAGDGAMPIATANPM